MIFLLYFFFFQAEDGIRDGHVTGVQTCALPISIRSSWTWSRCARSGLRLIPSSSCHAELQQTLLRARSARPTARWELDPMTLRVRPSAPADAPAILAVMLEAGLNVNVRLPATAQSRQLHW